MEYALVTGASRGIGRAVAVKLAADGYHVILNYRSGAAEAEQVLQEIKQAGGCAELLPFDVSDPQQIEKAISAWAEANSGTYISLLVNNAGITADNLMVFMTDQQWDGVIRTNLDSFFYVTRQLLKDMIVGKKGNIVNIVSLSGQKGHPGQANYAAAKAGVIAATKSLAMEVGKKKIRVNAVAPGFIKTDMTDGLNEQELKKMVPLNRFGTPQEVAETVSFLASEKSAYITGETISINGGMYS
jgi:3-oxoacyl-[acyl-carrier protein] reductase